MNPDQMPTEENPLLAINRFDDPMPDSSEVKIEINKLLWRYLHPNTRIGVAKSKACAIHKMIMKTWVGEYD